MAANLIPSQEQVLLLEHYVTLPLFLSNKLLSLFGCIKKLNKDHSAWWFPREREEDWEVGKFSDFAHLVSSQPLEEDTVILFDIYLM